MTRRTWWLGTAVLVLTGALLVLALAGCATAPPAYVCYPARIESGETVMACLPVAPTK